MAESDLNAKLVSFNELLEQSDVLSVHAALTDETKELFDAEVFKRMRPSSIFINTARGGIHKEEDLINALRTNTIWGAGHRRHQSGTNATRTTPYCRWRMLRYFRI